MSIMLRHLEVRLLAWNESPIRSPLLLIGPRQVGKTTLLRSLANKIGKKVYEVNFWEDTNDILKNIFKKNGDARQIMKDLADYFRVNEIILHEDILLIDEVQECPEAYSSLKSFKEKLPALRVLVTGSYLQLFLKNEEIKKLPVGCVDEFNLGPLTFSEFLQNYDSVLYEKLQKINTDEIRISVPLHNQLLEKLNEYFFVGGLPEVVYLYLNRVKNIDLKEAIRKKQKDLINQYILDFQKYGKSVHIKKIDKLFQSIPIQLDKSNEESTDRFHFNELGKNAKYNSFHWSFQFLENAGLIIRSFIVSKIETPFRVHEKMEERNIFKCFYFDIGLLSAALNSPLDFNLNELGSYKGYLAENFIAIHLKSKIHHSLITYQKTSKKDSAEVEFILPGLDGKAIPLEVKSSKKSLKSKSLDSFIKEYSPTKAYKLAPITGEGLEKNKYKTLPLYLVEKINLE